MRRRNIFQLINNYLSFNELDTLSIVSILYKNVVAISMNYVTNKKNFLVTKMHIDITIRCIVKKSRCHNCLNHS